MGIKLFDNVVDDGENLSKIEINKEFAKRYEHNKKREDLQRLEEMKKKGLVNDSDSDTESSSESDIDDEMDDNDVKFIDALLKVRNKDPILREKDAKLFDDDDDGGDVDGGGGGGSGERGEKREKRKKPKYLKDVIAEQLIEKGPEFEEEEEEEEEERESGERVKSYMEEQEEIRREVLDGMAAAERESGVEGEEFFKEKEREEDGGEGEGEEEEEDEVKKRLDEYFGEDEKLDDNDMFLKDFFRNKMWIDREKGKNKVIDDDDVVGFSEDEEWIEEQEDYERDINFRHEQSNVSDRVEGHSRRIEGSVRKETNARKQQRERKKERMAQAEFERQEEVKRLKNLKRKEIQERLNKIREIGGFDEGGVPFNEEDLEEDFDPVKFDEKLKNAYGDEYYEKEDVDPDFGNESESDLEKPDFEKEDQLLGLPKDWDVIKSSDGFVVEREKIKKRKSESGSAVELGTGGDDGDDEEHVDEGKRRRKRKKSAIKEALDKEIEEELYELDYEGSIGDLKTRFKYREVKPSKYGLSAADILMLDEKELNQYVSLKKLATYREQEWRVPQMKRQLLFQGLLSSKTNQKKRKRRDDDGGSDTKSVKEPMEAVKEQGEGQSVDESTLSRAARRRRAMKEKKLPESRLIAYGKMPASSKNKKKS